jgi:starch synthase
VLETVKKLRWVPDIIHCQGWMSSVVPFYVKTAYRDEPSFAETKVVTSLFSKTLKDEFAGDFKQFVEFRDAKADLLGDYKDQFDFDELSKLAIDYSDGVIQAAPDVEKSLVDFAAGKNIPVLGYNEDFADAYETFYESLFPDENE